MDSLFASIAPLEWLLVAVAVLFAALMRAFSGFGFALMAVPVFSLFLQPGDAVVLSSVLILSASVFSLKVWWGQFDAAQYWPMVLGSVVGTGVGVLFLASVSAQQFQLWIGVVVIIASIVLARFKPAVDKGGPRVAGVTGVCSGLMNGAFAIPGPPVIVYAMITMPDPARSRAFLMAFFFASNVISMTTFTVAGIVTATPFYAFMVALPVMLLGDRFGGWLFKRVGGKAYRPAALVVCLGVGVAITTKALLSGA